MIILQRGTLTQTGRIRAESMGLDLEERSGRIMMTAGPEEPLLTVGQWLMDDTEPGRGIVWRVAGAELQWETRTWRYTLEHIVNALKDQIIYGETDMSGQAADAAANILSRSGGTWTLGACEYAAVSLPYTFDGETLYDALETVSDTLADCVWEYDLSAVPFKLYLRNKPADKVCEMRAGRNLKALRQSVDRSQMYTRFYPIGKEDMRIAGDYVSANEGTYGVISRTETNQAIDSEAMLRAWAEDRIRRHSVPTVTITVTGYELSEATGESLDRIRPGAMCRVPLPETGGYIYERVVKVSWRDKLRDPEGVTVTLANKVTDVATIIRKEVTGSSSSAKKGGRAGAKKAKEDHAWFTDTEDHVAMTAEAIIGKDASGKVNWSRVANLSVDGKGIHGTVTETKNGLVTAQTKIEQTEKSIGQFVEAVGEDGEITAASIVASINDSGSSVVITADHIKLDGNVSLNSVMSVSGNFVTIKKPLRVDGAYIDCNELRIHDSRIAIDSSCDLMVKSASHNQSTNTLTLQLFNGQTINFKKATALSGQWSGGIYTVTAQGDSGVAANRTQIKNLAPSGGVSRIGKNVGQMINVYATENGTGAQSTYTGYQAQVWIDATSVYNQAQADMDHATLTYERAETLSSGTTRYHYYTTGTAIMTSGTKTVYW